MKALIILNGEEPSAAQLAKFSAQADVIIAADGAANKHFAHVIIGDLDSLERSVNPHARVISRPSQERCDFTKAVKFALDLGACEVDILGAGGLRDDHAVANFALFMQFGAIRRVRENQTLFMRMHTNFGSFFHLRDGQSLSTQRGGQISIFARSSSDKLSVNGVKFALNQRRLRNLSAGTLNEALGNKISLQIQPARSYAVVFLALCDGEYF